MYIHVVYIDFLSDQKLLSALLFSAQLKDKSQNFKIHVLILILNM